MARTRAAALDGAMRCIEKQGSRKSTMSDIAALGGIAKATLYNHFRTKDDVFAALIDDQVRRLADECQPVAASEGLAAALLLAVDRVAAHPALRRVATDEPTVLAALATPSPRGTWAAARSTVAATLSMAGCDPSAGSVDLVLRWLASHLLDPGTPASRAAGAGLVARVIGAASPAGRTGTSTSPA
jgi:AcrR family transcriptional regulator